MIFTLCVALGLCAWQIKWKKLIVYQFLLAFVFACTDEFHQLFVPDRSGKFTDVLIDSVGITVGVLIVYFVVTIISKRRKVKELKAEI